MRHVGVCGMSVFTDVSPGIVKTFHFARKSKFAWRYVFRYREINGYEVLVVGKLDDIFVVEVACVYVLAVAQNGDSRY